MDKLIETEVGYLPENWTVSTVLEEAELVTDYIANGSFASLKENVTYKSNPDFAILVRLVDFSRNFSSDFVYVDEHSYNFLRKSKLLGGEIIISNVGEYAGTVFRAPDLGRPMTLGPNAVMLNFKNGNDFYYYWFKSPNGQSILQSIRTGSAVPKFNKTDFRNSKIPVPPPHEQIQIASILSSLDNKIGLLHRQNKTLEYLAETLFRQWFVDEAEKWWELTVLKKVGKVVTGKTPSTTNKEYWGIDIPFITPTDFKDFGKYVSSADRFISTLGMESVKNTFLSKGSILVTCIGSDMGKVAITLKSCVTNQQINSLIINDNFTSQEYIYQYLKSIFPLLRSMASSGSTMPIINKSDFENIEIPIPPEDILMKYESITLSFNNKILSNTQQIRTLTQLRDMLLPKLMSGEVRVN